MNPAISNPIKITGRPIINNNAFAIPHVALHAKTMNLIDNISIPITNNVIIRLCFRFEFCCCAYYIIRSPTQKVL